MISVRDDLSLDGVQLVRLESDHLRVEVAPSVGGRIVSLLEKSTGLELLWRNRSLPLTRLSPGTEYDPHFYGGIDELLPNDIPEVLGDVNCPDHGELWTTPLEWQRDGDVLLLRGLLPRFGLVYERQMSLRSDSPFVDFVYRLVNPTRQARRFLWKLHAALAVEPGDLIDCPARKGKVVDLAWSRFNTLTPFAWPIIEGRPANVVPLPENTVDFFYLYDLAEGRMAWRRPGKRFQFEYHFDTKVFPYAWMFASYGGFNGHYTVILEPCTTMPLSVTKAAAQGQCSVLQPGELLETRVSIRAGCTAASQADPPL